MSLTHLKLESFRKALLTLEEVLLRIQKAGNSEDLQFFQDSAVQRFEYCKLPLDSG